MCREAAANVLSPRSRLAVPLGMSVLVGIGITAGDAADIAIRDQAITELVAAGWSTFQLVQSDEQVPPSIDAASCGALTSLSGVLQAGALVLPDEPGGTAYADVGLVPRDRLDLSGLSGGRFAILDSSVGEEGVLRLVDGVPTEVIQLDLLADPVGLGRSVVVPTYFGHQRVRRCVVVVEPGFVDQLRDLLPSLLSTDGAAVVARAYYAVSTSDPYDNYERRLSKWLCILLGTALGLMLVVVHRLRSSEVGAYLVCSPRRLDVGIIQALETFLVSGGVIVGAVSSAIALDATQHLPSDSHAVTHALLGAFSTLAVGSLATVRTARSSTYRLLKDR